MGSKAIIQTEKGDITIEFFDNEAPNTVKNFLELAKSRFYDGVSFHRVIPNFVIQGGDPTGTGGGGPGYCIPDELGGNPHRHEIGALSMAHAGPNTGGSQFFIVRQPQPHLDGKHTVFGKVVDGLQVIYDIEQGDKMLKVEVLEESDKMKKWSLKKIDCPY